MRFVSAHPKDVHATFGVQLAALRPGWLHKNGRWAGHWQPKVKSKRMLEREAHFEKVKLAWPLKGYSPLGSEAAAITDADRNDFAMLGIDITRRFSGGTPMAA